MVNYQNKKIALTGWSGFIGSALKKELDSQGARVFCINGDVRNPGTFSSLDHTYDYIFHFAAPSSQVLFKRKMQYCVEATVKGYMNAADAARRTGAKLVYPSTGVLSQGATNEYSKAKEMMDIYISSLGIDYLGVRLFAAYGPGEGHKADYASVPYLFADDWVIRGRHPLIFGNGEQKRDFIYIDDAVEAILTLAEERGPGIVDVGSGEQTSFNEIVEVIQEITQTKISPVYVARPANYVDETSANTEQMFEFYRPRYSFYEGMDKLIRALDWR